MQHPRRQYFSRLCLLLEYNERLSSDTMERTRPARLRYSTALIAASLFSTSDSCAQKYHLNCDKTVSVSQAINHHDVFGPMIYDLPLIRRRTEHSKRSFFIEEYCKGTPTPSSLSMIDEEGG